MKTFLSVDMEGISGLVRWADVGPEGPDFQRNRELMTLDANAAITGAFDGGATEVAVEENHGAEDLCCLRLDLIDPRCHVVRGAGRPTATCMAALDASTGVLLFVGHHGRAGSWPGIMAHTVSYGRFQAVRLAGNDAGETDLFTIRAGELGVPVGLITGDQVVIEQVRKRSPEAEAVQVKQALSPVRRRNSPRPGTRSDPNGRAARRGASGGRRAHALPRRAGAL